MSNLYKRGTTVSKDERVIDYNEIIRDKIQSLLGSNDHRVDPDGFVNGLNADMVETLLDENGEPVSDVDALSFDPDRFAMTEAKANEIIANANTEAEGILENANNQAMDIINQANNEANNVLETARANGYNDGMQKADTEINQKIAELEAEYDSKKKELMQEYEAYKEELEPELVEVLSEVFRKVTLTIADDTHDIIMHLINNVMRNADTSHDFIIKVSPDDYTFLINHQGKIYSAISREIHMDILEDITLNRNECVIETDTGIFDCSLDIELENLIRDLKLLSCI